MGSGRPARLAQQRGAADAESTTRRVAISACLVERASGHSRLLLQRQIPEWQRLDRRGRSEAEQFGRGLAEDPGQLFGSDVADREVGPEPLDHVLELPDVARPEVTAEHVTDTGQE